MTFISIVPTAGSDGIVVWVVQEVTVERIMWVMCGKQRTDTASFAM